MPLKMSEKCNEFVSIPSSTMATTSNGIYETLNEKILKVYSVLDSALEQNYLSNCFISFNGGKDCTVLLHLVKSYMCNHNNSNKDENKLGDSNIRVIYIQPNNSFKEVEEFVNLCEQIYNTKIERYQGKIRSVLEEICKQNPNLKAVIMGSRRSDPYCHNLKTFQPTDPNWPPLIRINPLLDWTTKDIWNYIKFHNIAYCTLYDEGYTSLGDTTNTQKNPHLKFTDPITGEIKYRPAYELLDDNLERAGRL